VVLVDDHEFASKSVRAVLGSRADLDVVGEAAETIAKTASLHPNLVVKDVSMPGIDGISAASEILKLLPRPAVVLLSMHDTSSWSRAQATSARVDTSGRAQSHQHFSRLSMRLSAAGTSSPDK
jgi:DNA-binding NarL/FixJ family response regulator